MFFYILLVVVIVCLFVVTYLFPRTEKSISLTLLGILIFLGGFRDHIGWDYCSYTNWYLNGTRDDGLEFGFLWIMKIFRYLNLDYHFLLNTKSPTCYVASPVNYCCDEIITFL